MKKSFNIVINEEVSGNRLDIALSSILPSEISRSFLKNHLITLKVNGKIEKLSYKCKMNDNVFLEVEFENNENVIPQDIKIDIIYEDKNYIVINKKHGMVVHPAKGNFTGTLVNALLGLKKELYENEDKLRIGIVHRLDKETSGLIIIAKNKKSHDYLTGLFKKREIEKKYHAIVYGNIKPLKFKIEKNIGRNPKNRKKMAVLKEGGKKSITEIVNVKYYNNFSYIDIKLITGRTHQIRVHLSNYGYPIVGDTVYSRRKDIDIPLCLVSYKISFYDIFSQNKMKFKINDPLHFNNLLK